MLAPEAFAEGFGLQTPMVTGQMNVVRYYPYFSRALEVVKKLIADSGMSAILFISLPPAPSPPLLCPPLFHHTHSVRGLT